MTGGKGDAPVAVVLFGSIGITFIPVEGLGASLLSPAMAETSSSSTGMLDD
jgi:hypothetical protein